MASKTGAGNIKVGVRIRPMIAREESEPLRWKMQGNRVSRFDTDSQRLSNPMEFDHVFGENVKNNEIFNTLVEPLVLNAVKGFNATILAYGQTSSGKTHTMIGSDKDHGIVPLTMENIFHAIDNLPEERSFLLGVSFLEVYNEKVRDLLNPEKSDLKVFETPEGNISTDCHVEMVNTSFQMIDLMEQGNKNKSIGETNMNDRSSRSHTIFRITIESQDQQREGGVARVSQINLVDLAGSERASQTGATGQRYKEGCAINRSLLQLGNVVQKLSEEKGEFIDYRSSKLTRILQPSLSGNANIVMICNVTPYSADQTANTLLFASRASTIKLDPHLNEIMDDATLLKRHTKRIKELEKNLQEASLLKEKNQTLEKEIEKLKDMLIVSRLPSFKHDRQRALRRQTWGGPGLKLLMDNDESDNILRSNVLDVIRSVPDARLSVPDDRKVSLPESITVRNDDFNDSVCMSIDEFENIPPFITSRGEETPSKLRMEIKNLKHQLAEKAAATPVLRERIALLEKDKEEQVQQKFCDSSTMTDLQNKMQLLEVDKDDAKPGTPVPKLRERIKDLEEKLENEHTEHGRFKQTLEEMEKELRSKTEALQLKSKEFEVLLKEKSTGSEAPGTPVSVLHDRIKQLQEKSSQLPGTPPALLRKKIRQLEDECKYVEQEFSELREFTTLEKQIYGEFKVKELRDETIQLKMSLHDYEQICADLRKDNSELTLRNVDLKDQVEELSNSVEALAKELETNKMWNSKSNEQQLIWKKDLDQCRETITEMKNQSQDWMDEKEILKSQYESKIKELTASLAEAWSSQGSESQSSSNELSESGSQTDHGAGSLSILQKRIVELEAALAEAHIKTASISANTSCQTDHDLEEMNVTHEEVADLQVRLQEAEKELATLREKTLAESSSQTEHDDEIPSDTHGLMPELERVLDEKNSLTEELDKLAGEHADLKMNMESVMLEYESMQAEVQDLRLEVENAQTEVKKVDALKEEMSAVQVMLREKEKEIDNFLRLRQESEEAFSAMKAESDEVLKQNGDLRQKVALLEDSIVDQEQLQEKLFFMSQENDFMKTQLDYKQESLNFNLTDMERLKHELSQAKLNAVHLPDTNQDFSKDISELNKKIKELELERNSAEERKQTLELKVQELENQVSTFEEMTKQKAHPDVFEFHHDSLTLAPVSEVENDLRKEIEQLKAQLEAKNATVRMEELEEERHNLSLHNHELEDRLSETLEQINQQGLLPQLVSQLSSPAPQIEEFVAQQLEELKKTKEELEISNEELRAQLDDANKKKLENAGKTEELDSFLNMLQIQVKEVTGDVAKASSLKDLHAELLNGFMEKSQSIYSSLNDQLKQLEDKYSICKKLLEEQIESSKVVEAEKLNLQEMLDEMRASVTTYDQLIEEYRDKVASQEADLVNCQRMMCEMQSKLDESRDDSMVTMNGKELELTMQLHEAKDCLEMAVSEERQLRAKLAAKEQELVSAQDSQNKLNEKIKELESNEQGLRAVLDEAVKIVETTKEKESAVEIELASTREKILELEHALDVTEKSSSLDRQKCDQLKKELDHSKKKLAEAEDLELKMSDELMDKVMELEKMAAKDAEIAELKAKISHMEGLSSRLSELEPLKQQVAELAEYQSKAAEMDQLLEKVKALEQCKEEAEELPQLRALLEELQIEKAQMVQQLSGKDSELDGLRSECERLQSETEQLEDLKSKLSVLDECQRKDREYDHLKAELLKLSKSSEELHEVREKLQEMKHTMQVLEETASEAEQLRSKMAELEAQLDDANKNIEARKTYAANLEEELASVKSAASFLDKSANTTTDLQLTLDGRNMEQILALESVNMNLKSELQKMVEERECLVSERSSLEEKVSELEHDVSDLKEKCSNLKNLLAQHSAIEAKSHEEVSTLRNLMNELRNQKDQLQIELQINLETLKHAQEAVKVGASDAETQLQEKQNSLLTELEAMRACLQEKDKALQQVMESKQSIENLFKSKSEEMRQTELKYSSLLEEQKMCFMELEDARQKLETMEGKKSELESNLEMYKANIESLRSSLSNAESERQQTREQLKVEAIRLDNERYEIEVQLQEKMNLISDLEAKITNTNTLLNKISGERDVLTIRLQETMNSLASANQGRDELMEKCKEGDNDYEELLTAYREVELKSKNYHIQSINLRKEKDELTARLQKLEVEVSSLGSVDHSTCQQNLKQMEARVQEKHSELVVAKRELSNARGELIHLKMNMRPEPSVFEEPALYALRCKELEKKISTLQEEMKDLNVQLTVAKIKKEKEPAPLNFCRRCLPGGITLECGSQAVASTKECAVQAPPDNDTLYDRVEGYTPTSAITEAARMYGMREQIRNLETKNEELTKDRKLFKDVLRKRLVTIKLLEAQLGKEHPGQENKSNAPLVDKN